jgi:hypothetical protein|tara:strand:+ start:1604 stop:2326 length:723 start_codon:yes stop_codon:yes gene_type:complete
MASTYSTNAQLELITTGEKAGLWGTITNTNLQIVEQTSTGVLDIDISAGSSTLVLTDGSTSTGKNFYYRLHGTLAANRTVTMPATAERIWIMKDDTVRGTSNYTVGVLTASGTTQPIPPGATVLCKSNGTQTVVTILEKGYATITNSNSPYTAVAGAQILANTTTSTITVTLPAAASTGDEVTIIDAYGTFQSNNLTVDRNGLKINSGTSNLTLSNNGQSLTLVYVDATRGWVYKTNYTS